MGPLLCIPRVREKEHDRLAEPRRLAGPGAALGGTAAPRGDEPPPAVFPAESKAAAGRSTKSASCSPTRSRRKRWRNPDAPDRVGRRPRRRRSGRSVGCRWLCHALLAALPPDALASYREGADPQAKKLLEQAVAGRDVRLLRKVVDEALCSRPRKRPSTCSATCLRARRLRRGRAVVGPAASSLLAQGISRRRAFVLYYPDPKTDPPGRGPRCCWPGCSAAPTAGPTTWRRIARNTARQKALAGKQGRYADILRQVADEHNADPPAAASTWPTFGGDAARGRIAAAPPRLLENRVLSAPPTNAATA